MGVPITSFFRVLRAILADRDPDIQLYEDSALADQIAAVVSLGEVPGYTLSEDGLCIVQDTTVRPGCGFWDASYQYSYGYAFNFAYANTYNKWYDQSFMFFVNNPPTWTAPTAGDLTPTGNPHKYALLIWKTANLFNVQISSFHFKTRAVSESINAPSEAVFFIQQKIYDLENGAGSSGRPEPLPLIAAGVRSLTSGFWYGNYAYLGYDLAGF